MELALIATGLIDAVFLAAFSKCIPQRERSAVADKLEK